MMTAISMPAAGAALAQSQPSSSPFVALAPFFIIMVIFYVLLIMPQQKQRKKLQQMLSELKSGDKVITSGGIYGTILGVEGDTVQLRIAEQVRIRVSKQAIAGLQAEPKEG
jgi:preprotein translocase subunit YajC